MNGPYLMFLRLRGFPFTADIEPYISYITYVADWLYYQHLDNVMCLIFKLHLHTVNSVFTPGWAKNNFGCKKWE